eukprot:jgi/Mesvir1/4316/Mv14048-RA.1
MAGVNGSLIGYGPTGSGKTFTISGIAERAVHDIFEFIEQSHGREFLLRVSALEIYNELVHDLLHPESGNLRVLDDPERGTVVDGLEDESVSSPEDVFRLLHICSVHRTVGSHKMNEKSSRSHLVIRMTIENGPSRAVTASMDKSCLAPVWISTMTFADLAGSERLSKTGAKGQMAKEGIHINRSLLTLCTVIQKLSEGSWSHIPYRDSKLTRILQPSLGGNARTAIICTMSPARSHLEPTRSTLLFASRAKQIRNRIEVNQAPNDKADVARMQAEVELLELQLRQRDEELAALHTGLRHNERMQQMEQQMAEAQEQRDRAQAQLRNIAKLLLGSQPAVPFRQSWSPRRAEEHIRAKKELDAGAGRRVPNGRELRRDMARSSWHVGARTLFGGGVGGAGDNGKASGAPANPFDQDIGRDIIFDFLGVPPPMDAPGGDRTFSADARNSRVPAWAECSETPVVGYDNAEEEMEFGTPSADAGGEEFYSPQPARTPLLLAPPPRSYRDVAIQYSPMLSSGTSPITHAKGGAHATGAHADAGASAGAASPLSGDDVSIASTGTEIGTGSIESAHGGEELPTGIRSGTHGTEEHADDHLERQGLPGWGRGRGMGRASVTSIAEEPAEAGGCEDAPADVSCEGGATLEQSVYSPPLDHTREVRPMGRWMRSNAADVSGGASGGYHGHSSNGAIPPSNNPVPMMALSAAALPPPVLVPARRSSAALPTRASITGLFSTLRGSVADRAPFASQENPLRRSSLADEVGRLRAMSGMIGAGASNNAEEALVREMAVVACAHEAAGTRAGAVVEGLAAELSCVRRGQKEASEALQMLTSQMNALQPRGEREAVGLGALHDLEQQLMGMTASLEDMRAVLPSGRSLGPMHPLLARSSSLADKEDGLPPFSSRDSFAEFLPRGSAGGMGASCASSITGGHGPRRVLVGQDSLLDVVTAGDVSVVARDTSPLGELSPPRRLHTGMPASPSGADHPHYPHYGGPIMHGHSPRVAALAKDGYPQQNQALMQLQQHQQRGPLENVPLESHRLSLNNPLEGGDADSPFNVGFGNDSTTSSMAFPQQGGAVRGSRAQDDSKGGGCDGDIGQDKENDSPAPGWKGGKEDTYGKQRASTITSSLPRPLQLNFGTADSVEDAGGHVGCKDALAVTDDGNNGLTSEAAAAAAMEAVAAGPAAEDLNIDGRRPATQEDVERMTRWLKRAAASNIRSIRDYIAELQENVRKLQYQKQLLVCQVLKLEEAAAQNQMDLDAAARAGADRECARDRIDTLTPIILRQWEELHVPLYHRSRFFLAFMGMAGSSDPFYLEVESRRLTWLCRKKASLAGNGPLAALHAAGAADAGVCEGIGSERTIQAEKAALCKRMNKAMGGAERMDTYKRWGIPVDMKHRKRALFELVWADGCQSVERIQDSAMLVTRLLDLKDVPADNYELVYATPRKVW